MAAIQLSIKQITHHEIVEEIKTLADKKRKSSAERNQYKNSHKPQASGSYERFFEESDSKRKSLREEIRFLHLAYNFIKRTPYKRVELRVSEENRLLSYHCENIFSLIERYTPGVFSKEQVLNWVRQNDEK